MGTIPPQKQGGFLITPPAASIKPDTKHYLIYFSLGTPEGAVFTIYGKSLLGFEDTPVARSHGPYSFTDVIDSSFNTLFNQRMREGERKGRRFDDIIFMGHSVGSYRAIDIVSQLHHYDNPLGKIFAGAVLLFPTVTHIAQSPSGQKFSTLFSIPKFPTLVHYLSRALWPLSDSMLEFAVQKITGMPQDAARVSAGFLRGGTGVRQSLAMARDEIEIITEDRWDTEIWGPTDPDFATKSGGQERNKAGGTETALLADEGSTASPRTSESQLDYGLKFRFLFGTDDHWVADHVRDALISARGSGRHANVEMVVDETGILHWFRTRHSEQVAEKVALWIKEMIEL